MPFSQKLKTLLRMGSMFEVPFMSSKSATKLLGKLFSVNEFPISNYALKERASSKKPQCMVICNALNVYKLRGSSITFL